ncbi:hypothetical protein Mgra_00008507 [Meloidogyne graminicola]|uniref:Uncharacterized protein n=1 Tax=Meloidogyne graminicola TaxID=189291 RepID=A0A8S9ZFK4_9BILA|nr:hypothetical protein Mgra_00008507 [Meloidogyne graminicola]
MFGKLTTLNKVPELFELLFMAILIVNLLSQSESAISPLFDPIDIQENNNRQLGIEFEEYLKQLNKINQQKFNSNGNYILIPQRRIYSQAKAFNIMEKRGDEKRRDFEHGWEQCEFSPISCMLRRRKR